MTTEKKPKILLVDDDQKFLLALTTFLSKHQYDILIAYDATFAIANGAKNDIDLIVLDMGLPGGGGLFVLENLRRIPKTMCVPIIVSTASVEMDIEQKVRNFGANDIIQKPYELETLLEKIQRLLPQT